jgi:hypothetical protein
MPAEADVAPLGLVEEAALLDESHVLPKVGCGSGEISEETLRFNGLSPRIGIEEAFRAEGFSPDTALYQAEFIADSSLSVSM